VVVAPHPDDFDAIGVTLRMLHARGVDVHLCVLTSGARGVEDGFCSPPLPELKARIRLMEQRDSCHFFGLPPERIAFLRLSEGQDGELLESPLNLNRLRAHLEELQPHLLFLPHDNDTNAGHRRAGAMVRAIVDGWARPVALLWNEDPKTVALRRDALMPFGDTEAQWKARLLRFHASQQARNLRTRGRGFDERILETNRRSLKALRAQLPAPLQAQYAEVFELHVRAAAPAPAPVSLPASPG
jgi:LmbE family N-acetylglucosaminyl deacetylase